MLINIRKILANATRGCTHMLITILEQYCINKYNVRINIKIVIYLIWKLIIYHNFIRQFILIVFIVICTFSFIYIIFI